jgi:hypothetical protein
MQPIGTSLDDPWSTEGLPLQSAWPVWTGLAIGLLTALAWLATGRLHHWPIGWIGVAAFAPAAVALARARPDRWREQTRLWVYRDVMLPWLFVGVIAWFSGVVGVGIEALLTRPHHLSADIGAIAAGSLGLLLFGGCAYISVSSQRPARRLPDALLARIGRPYPAPQHPRKVTAIASDGSRHEITILRGGFVARWPTTMDPADVVDVDTRPPPPT